MFRSFINFANNYRKLWYNVLMLRKLATQRILTACLLTSLSFGLNLCAVEGAFAKGVLAAADVDQKSNHDCGHHGDQKSQDKSEDEDQTCCSNFLAVLTFQKNIPSPDLTSRSVLLPNTFAQTSHDFLRTGGDYSVHLSSGKSPPTVFLLTHFTHAPPILS